MNIILMGMKHCGKSTVGRRLATEFARPFFDLDETILAGIQEAVGGLSIEDLFRQKGAAEFYTLEAAAYDAVCGSQQARKGFVLAMGGRTPFNPKLQRVLEQCGVLIYINTPVEIIVERILTKGTSTLLGAGDPREYLHTLYKERDPVYRARAHIIVDGQGDVVTVVQRIKDGLKEYACGGQ